MNKKSVSETHNKAAKKQMTSLIPSLQDTGELEFHVLIMATPTGIVE